MTCSSLPESKLLHSTSIRTNMFQNIIFAILLSTLLFSSCRFDNQAESNRESNILHIKEVGEVKMPLDSLTGFYNNIYYDGSEGKLYLLNEETATIYIFNYEERKVVNKIQLSLEGPNSVGENLYKAGILAQNDTLFVLNYMTRQLCMLNLNGEVLKRFELWAQDELNDPYIVASSDRMPVKKGKFIFFASENPFQHKDQTKINTVVRLDISTGEVVPCVNRPSIYNEGYFGNYYKLKNFLFSNPNSTSLFCAFGASPCIYELNDSCNIIDTLCFPHTITDDISPLDPNPLAPIVIEKLDDYEATTPSFAQFFHDNVNDVYYRIISHGMSKEAFRTNDRRKGPWSFSLVAYNKDRQKISEFMFNENEYAPDMAFINKYGLHMAKLSSYQEDENHLTFGVFNLVGNE